MKTLVAYYSLSGNVKYAAERIASIMDADLLELKPENEPPKNFLKFLFGGKSVIFGEKAYLNHFDEDPADYDCIVIGTPLWANRVTPAVREFIMEHPFEHKKVGLFASSAGGDAEEMLSHLRKLLAGNNVAAVMSLKDQLKMRAEADAKIDEFTAVLKGSNAPFPVDASS